MKVKRFFAPDMRQAMRRVREEIGPDAVIVSNHRVAGGVEVVAAHEADYEVAQQQFTRERKKTNARQDQIDILTGKRPDLEAELQKARMQIAEAEKGSQKTDVAAGVNRQLEASDEDDLRSILQSLKDRQKQQANHAHDNFVRGQVSEPDVSSVDPFAAPLAKKQPELKPQSDALIRSMQDEIAQLKNLLNQQMIAQPQTQGAAAVAKTPVQRKLELLGVSERVALQVLAAVDPNTAPDKAWKTALARLSEAIPVVDEDFTERGGMIAFVGPTGVGKTTTIGKLAARYVLKYGSSSLALVTTDTYRIAAHEQLRTFGRILDVPVRVVDENNSLDQVLHSLKSKRLVLIDTAGLNAQEAHSEQQLAMLEGVSLRLKKLLVVSCSSQRRVVEQAFHAYRNLGLSGCVLSKMDESGSLGEAISLIVEKRLPVTYVTDGQRIPDDIEVARKHELVSRAVVTAQRAIEAEKRSSDLDALYRAG